MRSPRPEHLPLAFLIPLQLLLSLIVKVNGASPMRSRSEMWLRGLRSLDVKEQGLLMLDGRTSSRTQLKTRSSVLSFLL